MRAAGTLLGLTVAVSGTFPACSPAHYQKDADRAVYRTLASRRARVPEVRGSLDVDAADAAAAPARAVTEVRLDLAETLRLAALASREYRRQREDVYLTALSLTGVRRAFEGRPGLGVSADGSRSTEGESGSVTPEASFSKSLEAGGSFVVRIATEFLKNLGDPVETARTILSADLVLPLARGGAVAARETLTQAERDVLYALREFARYQQSFVAQVSTSFYRTVLVRERLRNEETAIQSLERLLERVHEFGRAGRLPDFQVDQARQDLLRAQQRRVLAEQDLERSLDDLKTELGLPVGAKVVLAEGVIEALAAAGLPAPPLPPGEAIGGALARRLDLRNARDRREDAERRVAVAADALGPQADLSLGGDLETPDRQPSSVRRARPTARVGLDVDLPLDRTDERNDYRAAQIEALRARRDVEATEDRVVAEVRGAWRAFEQARESYKIQQEGVRLATRRVESADLNLQAGRATTRDLLEAEDALVTARNAVAAALVDAVVARIEYERDAGLPSAAP